MKVAIDIDDVLVEFNKGLIGFYNKKYNKDVVFEEMHVWRLDVLFNISLEEAINLVKDFYNSVEFEEINLMEGVKSALKALSKNHELIFITARHLELKEKTHDFFKENFPEIAPKIIFSSDEWNSGKEKHEICEDLRAEILIEDRREYALNCANKGTKVLLLNQPWNQSKEIHENIVRVKNWKEVLQEIKKIKEIKENEN